MPIESFIFDGLQNSFLRIFQAPSVWVTSTDKVKAVNQLFGNKKLSYPYILLTLSSMSEAEGRYNAAVTSLRGSPVALSTDARRYNKSLYLPTDFDVSVEFVSNSYESVLNFSKSWLFARRRGRLKFEVAYGSTSYGVSSVLSERVDIPAREADPENVQEYTVLATLVVNGYLSESDTLEGQIKDTLQVDATLDQADGEVIWSFKSSRDSSFPDIASPSIPSNSR